MSDTWTISDECLFIRNLYVNIFDVCKVAASIGSLSLLPRAMALVAVATLWETLTHPYEHVSTIPKYSGSLHTIEP